MDLVVTGSVILKAEWLDHLIKVLSIDGGGIRGIIPAMVLAEVERRTGKPVASLFQLIAGTSTGGLLAMGLSKPDAGGKPQYSASDLVKLYEDNGALIFSRPCWYRVTSLGRWADYKYPPDGIKRVLDRYFGGARLGDALVDLLLTAYEIEIRCPFFFRSIRARVNPAYDFLLQDVALAVTAAPTYFGPCKICLGDDTGCFALIDGGVYANNPGMCAYVEARTNFPDRGILLLSLGTGEQKMPLPYEQAKKWGLAGWVRPLLDVVFDGVSDTVDYQLHCLLPPTESGIPRYYRIQPVMKKEIKLDDVSPENIRHLKQQARQLIRENSEMIDVLCDQLLQA